MKILSQRQLILEHYKMVIKTNIEDVSVYVYKPRRMEKLPAYCLKEMLKEYAQELRTLSDRGETKVRWRTKNPDYGVWDAQLTLWQDPKNKNLGIFFCAIVVRPFSREASDHYGIHSGLPAFDRLLLMWDSREFDRNGGYDLVFNLSNPEDAEKIYTISNTDRDIAEK